VDELVELYMTAVRQPQVIRKLPANSPDIAAAAAGKSLSISGWALQRRGELESVLLMDAGGILGKADRFGDRVDVVEAYKSQNIKCASNKSGFSMSFDQQPSSQAIIRVVARDGGTADLPLATAREGQSFMVAPNTYLGIDRL